MVETVKREHRAKYYTLDNYLQIMGKHGLQDIPARYTTVDLAQSGEWATFTEEEFYAQGELGRTELARHMETTVTAMVTKQPAATSRRPHVNPIGPDGKPKRGRPRNEDRQPGKKTRTKSVAQPVTPRRPGKATGKRKRSEAGLDDDQHPQHDTTENAGADTGSVPSKRGRPAKQTPTASCSRKGSDPPQAGTPLSSAYRVPISDGAPITVHVTPVSIVREASEPSAIVPPSRSADVPGIHDQLDSASFLLPKGAAMSVDDPPLALHSSLLLVDQPETHQRSSTSGVPNGKHGLSEDIGTPDPPIKRVKVHHPTEEPFAAPNSRELLGLCPFAQLLLTRSFPCFSTQVFRQRVIYAT